MGRDLILRADDARATAADLTRAAHDVTGQFTGLRNRLEGLGQSFQGASATAFDERYQEWAESARQLIEALDSLGRFLDGAATAIEETDARLASQIR
jgi:WXG100 family type VII secretion target